MRNISKILDDMRSKGETERHIDKQTVVIRYEPTPIESLSIYKKKISIKYPKENKEDVKNAVHEFYKQEAEYLKSKEVRDIEVVINGKQPKMLTKEEFEVLTQILGNPGETKPGSKKYIFYL